MTHEPLNIDYALLYGHTSGASPIADSFDDEWPAHEVFTEVWGWTLWNNGLVIEYPYCQIVTGVLFVFHVDIVRLERWDLTKESRLMLFICLN